ncbi:MAG: XdhC family protein, partial [Desulfobacteraceae bacterium]
TLIIEPSARIKRVYLFGAGHVAQPTARFAAMVGFRVIVIDDRSNFANSERFPEAHDIRVIEDFEKVLSDLPINEDSFIVILTRGHFHDGTVLKQALKTNAGYIGMIGSRRKRDLIYDDLLNQGFSRDDFKRVHAPIGLSIGAETPEEIGMSIVAELIHKRAQLTKIPM